MEPQKLKPPWAAAQLAQKNSSTKMVAAASNTCWSESGSSLGKGKFPFPHIREQALNWGYLIQLFSLVQCKVALCWVKRSKAGYWIWQRSVSLT